MFFLGAVLVIAAAVVAVFILRGNTVKTAVNAVSESAYSEIVKGGYKGTAEQLQAALVSERYDAERTAFDFAAENGYGKSKEEWLKTVLGNSGRLMTTEKNSYDSACENGFTSTEEEWLKTLESINVKEGKTAYKLACENGFSGSAADWLDCLSGTIGKKGAHLYDFARQKGFKGTQTQLLIQLAVTEEIYSKDGKSVIGLAEFNGYAKSGDKLLDEIFSGENADSKSRTLYSFAADNGYKGSFAEWLCFLATPQYSSQSPYQVLEANGYGQSLTYFLNNAASEGDSSKDYYDFAVGNGYKGSEEEWKAIISGSFSASPYEVAVKKGYKGTEEDFYKEVTAKLNGKSAPSESIISKVYVDKNKHVIVELKDSTGLDLGETEAEQAENKESAKTVSYFTVTFKDFDGTVLAVKVTAEGGSVTPPAEPEREGYLFRGWDKPFDKVKENLTVTAMYEKNDKPTVSAASVKAASGAKEVEVAVSVRNNPGILGMALSCKYDDSVMTLKSVENGEAVSNVLTLSKSKTLESGCTFAWDGIEIKKDDVKDGNILIMHFEISDSAKSGKYPIEFTYEEDSIVDNNLNSVSVEVVNGNVEIVN